MHQLGDVPHCWTTFWGKQHKKKHQLLAAEWPIVFASRDDAPYLSDAAVKFGASKISITFYKYKKVPRYLEDSRSIIKQPKYIYIYYNIVKVYSLKSSFSMFWWTSRAQWNPTWLSTKKSVLPRRTKKMGLWKIGGWLWNPAPVRGTLPGPYETLEICNWQITG